MQDHGQERACRKNDLVTVKLAAICHDDSFYLPVDVLQLCSFTLVKDNIRVVQNLFLHFHRVYINVNLSMRRLYG